MTPIQQGLVAIVRGENARAALATPADLDRPFGDIGIDSLEVMAVMLKVMERYGVKIPDAEVENLKTVNLLARFVERELAERS